MIGRLTGILLAKQPPQVLLDVNGIGYEIDVPMSTFYNLPAAGQSASFYTHLVVREDAHLLYGFGSEDERHVFRRLIKVSGIGPKVALTILSGLSVGELAQAIAAQDAARLVKIPGIGKKTAERLVLELRDKLAQSAVSVSSGQRADPLGDALNALLALGYNEKEARWAMGQIDSALGTSEAIRQALKLLSKA